MRGREVPAKLLVALLGVGSAALLWPGEAQAIPVFARRYATSCQTCHTVFPKLTAFGEAFRRNGYRFPAGEDEDASEQEPVELGQEAHKKVFPDAVWPGLLPSDAPVAANVASWIRATAEEGEPAVSFDRVGGSVGLMFAGNFGDTFSAWAGASVEAEGDEVEIGLERVFAIVQFFDDPTMNLRIGRFEPGFVPYTMHRTLGPGPWMNTTAVGDNGFAPEPTQNGLELTGVLVEGRLAYAVGLVEGSGNLPNDAKDFYGRLAFKFGGMRLDGIGGAAAAEPWRDPSVTVGLFGYYGTARIGEEGVATQDDAFWIGGGDINALYGDFNLQLAFLGQRNRRPNLAEPDESVLSWHAFAQLDWVAYPWLTSGLRYERRTIEGQAAERASAFVYALAQANVRTQLIASVERQGGGDPELSELLAGLNVVF